MINLAIGLVATGIVALSPRMRGDSFGVLWPRRLADQASVGVAHQPVDVGGPRTGPLSGPEIRKISPKRLQKPRALRPLLLS
jgi:hypothetical protein